QTLELIMDLVVPKLRTRKYIHIWDAGCAMGPEPYSLAIILREKMKGMCFRNVTIHASDIDISNQFKRIIEAGVYHKDRLRSVPKSILSRYFRPTENHKWYEVNEEIKKSIMFQKHDLLTLDPVRSNLSLIVCKNVLLHFSEKDRINIINMFYSCLESGGFFVTERTQKLPYEFRSLFLPLSSNAQIFQKIGG
ncbi:MAG: CheR family methyltransferase, partial [Desulfobacteraceae bacterium]